MRSFFISHASVDREWALWAARELKQMGYVAHLNETHWRAAIGLSWIRRCLLAGHSVIMIVSKAYLARHDIFGKSHEMSCRTARDGLRNAILYLSVDSSLPLPSEQKARFCEISGIPESWARVRFKQFLAENVAAWPATIPLAARHASGRMNCQI